MRDGLAAVIGNGALGIFAEAFGLWVDSALAMACSFVQVTSWS